MSIEVLTKEIADLRKMVEEQGATNFHEGRRAAAYWQQDDLEPRLKGLRPDYLFRRPELPEGYKPHTVWKSFGQYLREGMQSFHKDLGGNQARQLDFTNKYQSVFKSVQGMSTTVGGDGGFAVLPEFAPKIHDRVYDNDLVSRIDSYTVTGNRMTFPRAKETSRATGSRAGGLQAYWVDEGAPATGSKPKLAETELRLKKLCIVVYLTQELIDDNSLALEQWVTRKVNEELVFMLGNSIINGIGGGMPLGILNSPALIPVSKESGQAADTILAENVVAMWARRLANTQNDGWVWLMHQSVEAALQLMFVKTGTTGGLVFMPPTGITGRPYSTLQGLPILPLEFSPTLGDAGDIILANMKEYVGINKGGVTQAQSTEVEFLSDQLALKFTMRFDGRPYDDAPVTPFQAGATAAPTQSAFITLEART